MIENVDFNTSTIDKSWQSTISQGLTAMEQSYLRELAINTDWLPGNNAIFNAFSLPANEVNYVLFGESPYPRSESANGYAFWDKAVNNIWSEKGLSREINRATSLRNFIKMLLVADGALSAENTSQQAIAQLDKHCYISHIDQLFGNMQRHGILLLNASPVLSNNRVNKEAKYWQPFISTVLQTLEKSKQSITLILFGKVAELIQSLPESHHFSCFYAEHPYNLSFIKNPDVINFFKSLNLLRE